MQAGRAVWLVPALLVLIVDQVTKWWAYSALTGIGAVEVTPFANLVLVFNRGAAFGMLGDAGGWQGPFFVAVAVAICAWILYVLLIAGVSGRWLGLGLSLILGGAVGNMIDRVLIGHVIDFIDLHAAGWHWPAFNVADSGITVGAALVVLDALRGVPAARHDASGPRS
jgi:signal peptidase II